MKMKVVLTLSLLLNIIFIGLVLAGVYKFNLLGDDVYIDDTGTMENIIYGEVAEIQVTDPNAPDPDAEAIAEVEAEEENFVPEEDTYANGAAGEEGFVPEEPIETLPSDLPEGFVEPDNSPIQKPRTTE